MKSTTSSLLLFGCCCLLLSLSACSHRLAESNLIDIDLDKSCHAQDMFSSYDYVQLETSDNCVISRIDDIKISQDKICVKDENTLFIFTLDGRFVAKIDDKGHSHGEYTKISDFCFQGQKILLLCEYDKKIMSYDFNGQLVEVLPLEDRFHSIMSCYADTTCVYLCCSRNNQRGMNIMRYDLEQKTGIKEFDAFEHAESFASDSFHDFIGERNDTVYVTHLFDKTVYKLSNDCFEPHVTFDINTAGQLPDGYESQTFYDIMLATRAKEVMRRPELFFQTNSMLMVGYELYQDGNTYYHITKSDNKGKQQTFAIAKTIDRQFPYVTRPFGLFHDKIVSAMPASSVLFVERANGLSLFKSKGLTVADNPIIFLHTIKKQ